MPVGSIVIRDLEAKDADAGINALVEYKVVPNGVGARLDATTTVSLFDTPDTVADGFGVFEFAAAHIPVLTLRQSVDYETVRRYLVTVVASVRKKNVECLKMDIVCQK